MSNANAEVSLSLECEKLDRFLASARGEWSRLALEASRSVTKI